MNIKRLWKVLLCFVVSILFLCLAVSPISSKAATSKVMQVELTSGTLNVRSGPGTNYKIIGSLKDQTKVTVYTQTKNGWSEILYNKKKSFVSSKYLRSASITSTAGVVELTSGTLNVRSGPGLSYKKMGSLKNGSKITVYNRLKSGWSEIKYNNKKAYVSTKYIRFYKKMSEASAKKIADQVIKVQRETWKKNYTKDQIYTIMSPHFSKHYIDQYFKQQMRMVGKDKNGALLYHVIETEIWGYAIDTFHWGLLDSSKRPKVTYSEMNGVEYLDVSQFMLGGLSSYDHTSTLKLSKNSSKENWKVYSYTRKNK